MSEEKSERKPWFNPEVNLGHVITMLGLGGAFLVAWVKSEEKNATQDVRLVVLEATTEKLVDNDLKFTETQAQIAATQRAQAAIQDILVRKVLK